MNDALLLVEILEGLGDLDNDVSGEFFTEVCQADNLVEELASGGKLKNNVVVLP